MNYCTLTARVLVLRTFGTFGTQPSNSTSYLVLMYSYRELSMVGGIALLLGRHRDDRRTICTLRLLVQTLSFAVEQAQVRGTTTPKKLHESLVPGSCSCPARQSQQGTHIIVESEEAVAMRSWHFYPRSRSRTVPCASLESACRNPRSITVL